MTTEDERGSGSIRTFSVAENEAQAALDAVNRTITLERRVARVTLLAMDALRRAKRRENAIRTLGASRNATAPLWTIAVLLAVIAAQLFVLLSH